MKIIPVATGSSGNLYLIKTINDNKYLLECGIKDKSIMKYLYVYNKEYINNYKACFISHIHSDHSLSAKWVNKYMPIYSNRQVMEKGFKGEVLKPNTLIRFDDFSVMPFNVEHGNAENYGYMFKDDESKILFITDFQSFDVNISNIKFTEIFIECNWTKELMLEMLENTKDSPEYIKFERQFNTHCSLSILVEILKNLDLSCCKSIHLIHASKEVCDKKTAIFTLKYMFPNINVNFIENERI